MGPNPSLRDLRWPRSALPVSQDKRGQGFATSQDYDGEPVGILQRPAERRRAGGYGRLPGLPRETSPDPGSFASLVAAQMELGPWISEIRGSHIEVRKSKRWHRLCVSHLFLCQGLCRFRTLRP